MLESLSKIKIETWEQGVKLIENLIGVASADAVLSEPTAANGQIVLTTAEVLTAMGFGYGMGSADSAEKPQSTDSFGGGGGGGGAASSRPVAAIIVSDKGVKVEPIVDVTKVGIAAMTAVGAIGVALIRMNKASH